MTKYLFLANIFKYFLYYLRFSVTKKSFNYVIDVINKYIVFLNVILSDTAVIFIYLFAVNNFYIILIFSDNKLDKKLLFI